MSLSPSPSPTPVYWQLTGPAWRRYWTTLFPPSTTEVGDVQWQDHGIRKLRYATLWSFYDGTVYQGYHGEAVRQEFNLYQFTKPLANPCRRIVDFHASHIWGGALDHEAGDGSVRPSCLPIVLGKSASDALRPAIASVFAASNWAAEKTLCVRFGAALGDVGLEAIPDLKRGLIRWRVVHPAEIIKVRKDPYGNVKSYELVRWEVDPEDVRGERTAAYKEVVKNNDGTVVYETFKNDAPYQWPNTPGDKWESKWGFIPFVLIKHINIGQMFGVSEQIGAIFKAVARDEQMSLISDSVKKTLNPQWFLKGAMLPPPPTSDPVLVSGDYSAFASMAAGMAPAAPPNFQITMTTHDGIPFITCNAKEASIEPLVFKLDIGAADSHVEILKASQEQDYPELVADQFEAGTAASGVAIEKARAKATEKVNERRLSYDQAVVNLLKMSATMGQGYGMRDFAGVGPNAYERGKLDFHIGPRPVFTPTESEKTANAAAKGTAVGAFVTAGVPLGEALRLSAVETDEIERVMLAKAKETAQNNAQTLSMGAHQQVAQEHPDVVIQNIPSPIDPQTFVDQEADAAADRADDARVLQSADKNAGKPDPLMPDNSAGLAP